MFRPVEMQKVLLFATRNSESRLISALHKAGIVEIRSMDVPGLEKGKPLPVHDDVSRELVRVRSLISAFQSLLFTRKSKSHGKEKQEKPREAEYSTAIAEAQRIRIDAELKELVDSRTALLAKVSELERKKAEVSALAPFSDLDFSKLETKMFTCVAGKLKSKAFPSFKNDLLEFLGKKAEILHFHGGKEDEVAIIFCKRGENIEFVLSRYGFERIQLPEGFSTFAKGMEALDAEVSEARKALAECEQKITSLYESNFSRLVKLEKELSILSSRASIATKFAGSRKIVAIEGWAKKKDIKPLAHMLKSQFDGEAELAEIDGEDAPTVLDNPKSVSQFQWLVEFYSLPAYWEFDPTFLLLFTVPIIYGMIVGDVGYGLMSIFLSLLILQKFKGGMLGNIAKIWLFSSVAAMAFGVVFDEWFGFTHLEFAEWLKEWGLNLGIDHSLYAGLSRSHNLSLVIGLTLLVGIAHLSIGFILGAINAWNHERKHAYAKIAWLALLLSGSSAVATLMFGLLPEFVGMPALAVFVVSGAIITYLEGLPGLFEIPGIAANTFSYARIAAAGVAGVIIAEIINNSLLPTPEKSIIMLPVFFLLHVLNGALAMFESIVQGGRLNLVEFYSKFFHGGGKAFEPFSMPKGESTETK